jgi:hypothetical protein
MLTVRNTRSITTAVLAVALAALSTACSSSAGSSTAATSTVATHQATGSASPSAPSPATEALAAYQAMWTDVAKAINTDDYQAPYLGDHLSGAALLTITDNMAADKKQGVVGHGAPILHPVVTKATASTAAISDCLDARAWLQYYASTGKLVDDVPGGFRATTATVTNQNGIWKVTQINTGADGTCHLSSPTG